MASDLQRQRIKFTRLICLLLTWANVREGWEVALGRDFDEQNEKLRHMRGSLHYLGLATDLAFYINGEYQTDSVAYKELGEKWKSLDPDCRWGGDFKDKNGKPRPDGNHFSVAFQGKA